MNDEKHRDVTPEGLNVCERCGEPMYIHDYSGDTRYYSYHYLLGCTNDECGNSRCRTSYASVKRALSEHNRTTNPFMAKKEITKLKREVQVWKKRAIKLGYKGKP